MAASSEIVAVSQQSRFHNETLEGTTKDVDLKQVNITIGDRQLLSDAQLRLFAGVHYGLIGRNGSGKSTLLKAMGWGLLTGFPKWLRCLYVDQLDGVPPDKEVLQVVLEADTAAVRLQAEAGVLEGALADGSVTAICTALRRVRLDHLEAELAEATALATLRSGERGLAARKKQVELEAAVADARVQLDKAVSEEEAALSVVSVQDRLSSVYEELEQEDASSAEARARTILRGLGFSEQQIEGPFRLLSGGWRMRVSLAQALFVQPDLLLLDEPTNHLDLPAILWLQGYLQGLTGSTLVVVSHDRAFLNAVAEEMMVLRHMQLSYHSGNYDEYLLNKEEQQLHKERLVEKLERKRTHMEKSIQEAQRAAKKAGDDKKLGMAASRRKKLEDRMGMEKNEKGHRFSRNADMAGYNLTSRKEIQLDVPDPPIVLKFPQPAQLRHRGPLLQAEGVSFRYPGGPLVLQDVTLNVEQGARLALVGANGGGKTTLARLLAGELSPSAGLISRHPEARIGYFQQHQVDQLADAANGTMLSYMMRSFPGVKEQAMRAHLGAFGIKGSTATQPLGSLSGGQAVRGALAHVLYPAPALLLLDEPTNHLDMDTITALVSALKHYGGAVLLVSHDQYLISSLAQQVWLVADRKLRHLEGGMEEYVKMLQGKKKKKKP